MTLCLIVSDSSSAVFLNSVFIECVFVCLMCLSSYVQTFVSPEVLGEVKRIVEDSEVLSRKIDV